MRTPMASYTSFFEAHGVSGGLMASGQRGRRPPENPFQENTRILKSQSTLPQSFCPARGDELNGNYDMSSSSRDWSIGRWRN